MKKLLFLLFIFLTFISSLYGEPVDLTKKDFYITRGFSEEWVSNINPSWKLVPGKKEGGKKIRVLDQKFPGLPQRTFFFMKDYKAEEFTFITSFSLNELPVRKGENPLNVLYGLRLGQIGINWAVYLNGSLIRKEIFLNGQGEISIQRNLRNITIPVNSRFLKKGTNILAFHIIGDPAMPDTGFYKNEPYFIDRLENLEKDPYGAINLIIIFISLFIGVYHLFLYSYRTSDYFNLYFGIFSSFLFMYFFCESPYIFQLIRNTAIIYRLKIGSLAVIMPAVFAFLEHILFLKLSRLLKVFTLYYFFFLLLIVFAPLNTVVNTMYLLLVSSGFIIIYYMVFKLFPSFISAFKTHKVERHFVIRFLSSLKKTVPGNLLLGLFFLMVFYVFDVVDVFVMSKTIILSKYGVIFLVIGISSILGNRFMFIFKNNQQLNRDLKQKLSDLDAAHQIITLSEKKYRFLVEGAEDIILSMDGDLNILSINETLNRQFTIYGDILSMNFRDLLHRENDVLTLRGDQSIAQINTFLEDKKTIQFSADFTSSITSEPVEMIVRLQYLNIEDQVEVIGRISSAMEDVLLPYLAGEKKSYYLSNSLFLVGEVIFNLVKDLSQFLEKRKLMHIRMALQEILINAVEHGNLGITSSDKVKYIEKDNYHALLVELQKSPGHKDKKIYVEYSLNNEKLELVVEDDGVGFDYESQLQLINNPDRVNMEGHGRGIALASAVFDSLEYSGSGNRVVMVKKFKD